MSARGWLHLAALLAPPLAAIAFCLLLMRSDAALAWQQVAIFGGIGVIAAQISAALHWRALERRARAGSGAWVVGLLMALLTHVLFGVLFDLAIVLAIGNWREAAGTGGFSDLILQSLFFVAMSILTVGVLTFPLTAALAQVIAASRRREIADGR